MMMIHVMRRRRRREMCALSSNAKYDVMSVDVDVDVQCCLISPRDAMS